MNLTTVYTAEDIFEGVLYEQNRRGKTQWQKEDRKIHRAFYDAQNEFPEIRGSYEFLVRTEPYSHRLEEMFWEFRQAEIIGLMDGKVILKDCKNLKKPDKALERVAKYICDRI